MEFDSIDKILDFAIQNEEEAYELYTTLANLLAPAHMKEVFFGFAHEEKGHKAKLLAVKSGEITLSTPEKIEDLKIADYIPDVKPHPNMNYQQALIVAMKAEKAAYKLYNDLAERAKDANVKELFLMLAQEEAKHKLRFEIEYDEFIMQEN